MKAAQKGKGKKGRSIESAVELLFSRPAEMHPRASYARGCLACRPRDKKRLSDDSRLHSAAMLRAAPRNNAGPVHLPNGNTNADVRRKRGSPRS